MRKWLLVAAAVVLIGAAAGGYQWMSKRSEKKPTVAVRTVKATKGELTVDVSGSGTAAPVNKETLRSTDNGTITDVLVKEGEIVKQGQVLVKFEGKDNSDAINQEELSLKQTQLNLDAAEKSFKLEVTPDNMDSLKSNIEKLKLQIQQSEEKIQSLQDEEAAPDPIAAPIDGTVTTVNAEVGQTVTGATDLVEMTNYQDLQVVIQVDELDINQVKLGQKANVTLDALPNQTISGTVSAIADEGSGSNGVATYDVTVHLDQSPDVKAGMTANAEVIIEDKKDVLLLPVEAVHQVGDRYFVTVPQGTGAEGGAQQQTADGKAAASGTERPQGSATGGAQQGQQGNFRTGGAQQGQQGDSRSGGAQQGQQGNFRSGSGAARQGSSGQRAAAQGGTRQTFAPGMKEVQVGSHNENYIEITSGLQEGDEVVLPTLVGGSSSSQQSNARFGGGGPTFVAPAGGFGGGGAGGVRRR